MNAIVRFGAVMAIAAGTATAAAAQATKTITGETVTLTATVESIERGRREVTVKKPDGKYETFVVPESMKRFDTLKIGDTIKARYYETMVLQLKAPGAKDVDTASAAVVPTKDKPSGTAATQQTITATITEIDPKVPSITFKGPRGWTYSSRVQDKAALAKVKVGDKVDITWTAATILAIEDAK